MSSVYYHHTDKESAKKIYKSKMIKQSVGSDGGDAAYGDGVYLTKMGPDHSITSVAKNNFDDRSFWEKKLDEGKLDVLIAVTLPDSEVTAVSEDRDIYLYEGDLHFSEAEDVKFLKRDGDNVVEYQP